MLPLNVYISPGLINKINNPVWGLLDMSQHIITTLNNDINNRCESQGCSGLPMDTGIMRNTTLIMHVITVMKTGLQAI